MQEAIRLNWRAAAWWLERVFPDLFGPGLSAEMAYYETSAGARVFSAGAMDFPAVLFTDLGVKLLDNLWRHMLEGLPGSEEPEPPEPLQPLQPLQPPSSSA